MRISRSQLPISPAGGTTSTRLISRRARTSREIETGHDRLAAAPSIVGQSRSATARQAKHMLVDGDPLMWQRIDREVSVVRSRS